MCTDCLKYTIAIDFDGVIHKYSQGWKDGTIYDKPVEGSQEALIDLKRTYHIYIHTTRNVPDVVKWMNTKFWGNGESGFQTIAMPEGTKFWYGGLMGEQIAVSNRKLPAVAYIDDRAIHFTNWNDVLKSNVL